MSVSCTRTLRDRHGNGFTRPAAAPHLCDRRLKQRVSVARDTHCVDVDGLVGQVPRDAHRRRGYAVRLRLRDGVERGEGADVEATDSH